VTGRQRRPLLGTARRLPTRSCASGVDDDLRSDEADRRLTRLLLLMDAAVEVVEVGGREAAASSWTIGRSFRGDDQDGLEDHLVGAVARLRRVEDLKALDREGLLWPLAVLTWSIEEPGIGVEVDLLEQVEDGLGRPCRPGVLPEAVGEPKTLLELAENAVSRARLLAHIVLEELPD